MKVVVTGASGFVGNRVVKELLKRGIETCAVARRPVEFTNSLLVGSYLDTPKADILIHLAENPNRAEVNKMGNDYAIKVNKLIKALILKDYQRIVFASSVTVYGDKNQELCKPMDPVFADDVYSKSKLNCELLIEKHNGVIARMSNLYGVGMSADNVVSKIINQIPCSGEIKVFNDTPVRDFLWIDDAVNALVEIALGEAKGIYNVASGNAVSINELAHIVLAASGFDKKCKLKVTKLIDEESSIKLDTSDTFNAFGWKPKMELKNGIKKLLSYKR
jgi:UDP-glucose 4-epimerase